MDLAKILEILKEVNLLVTSLKDMGMKVQGTIDLATILGLFRKP